MAQHNPAMGMYPLETYPSDSFLWEFLAYAAGTGGSILVIGSAAGIAAMGIERIEFLCYAKKLEDWPSLDSSPVPAHTCSSTTFSISPSPQ